MDLGERRAGLLCDSVPGKDSWENHRENDVCEGMCSHPNANRVHWECFDLPTTTTGRSLVQQHFQSKCLFVSQTRIFPVNIYSWICLPCIVTVETGPIFSWHHTKSRLIWNCLQGCFSGCQKTKDKICPVLEWPLLLTAPWCDMAEHTPVPCMSVDTLCGDSLHTHIAVK